jgi:HPt (histidine-containing phosphotransfer) domain-containing protein
MVTATACSSLATSEEAPVSPGGERDPIDHAYLRRFTLGDRALEHEVLGLFADQAPTYLLHLMAAESDRAWFEAAHALKGSARAVGAWRVALLAKQAEAHTAESNGRSDIIDALSTALGEARSYIARLTAAI